eukprot:GHVR01174064.1.p1 GENE.GHVR01174064.1~~GHVR01174064.1.p1  ORF type:complete len:119 (+),score=6.64 GHVR01174064.1:199-555(+)
MHLFVGIPGNTQNVALQTNGASCTASPSYTFPISQTDQIAFSCNDAIDGEYGQGDKSNRNEWVSYDSGVGAWIKVVFKQKYRIVAFSITNRYKGIGADLISEANVQFSSGPPIRVSCF